jgi:sugar lactone lactonase YvrE
MRCILQRVIFVLVFILPAGAALAQTRVITTAAGTGAAGFSGDGGPAPAAVLNHPSDVTVDSSGNFYIADRDNHRVRKVSVASGVINTVAGSGVAGWFFSGGPALFASLDRPSGVAVDSAGNVYIADLLQNEISRIHKVTGDQIARIELPMVLNGAVAIAIDSNNNLYIAEQAGHRIRRVDLRSGGVTTIAGNGSPGFTGDGGAATSANINGPSHLTIDSAGNVYFADSLNHRIRKIAAGSGLITTVAGTGPIGAGQGGFTGDGGPATSARLNTPGGVAVDGAGNVFIADTLNRRIRRVNARTGVITTVLGGGVSGDGCPAIVSALNSPDSLTVNSSGTQLYISDDGGNRIWKVTLDPNDQPPSLTSVSPPNGVVGTTVMATLTGSGFFGSAGPSADSTCLLNGTTVFVSGAGVTVGDVRVNNDSSLVVAFIVAGDAALGPRDITVTTDSGTSAARPFTVVQPSPLIPTLTSINPSSGVRGSSTTVTLTGTNFVAGATSVTVGGGGISVSDVRVTNTGLITAVFTIASTTSLGSHPVIVGAAGGSSNAVPFTVHPEGPAFVYQMPPILNPTENTPVQVGLTSPFADPVTGELTLTFVPNAANPADDPNATFINTQASTRSIDVTFSANASTAEFSLPSGLLQAGTVAGTLRMEMGGVQVGGVPVSPAGSDFDVQVPRLVPIITDVRILNLSSAGFDVEITGYSTSREISTATFEFGASSGARLLTVQLQPEVAPTFTDYYVSDMSAAVGSSFVYTQPFLIKQGSVRAVATVTVSLTNAQGTSEPKTVPVK